MAIRVLIVDDSAVVRQVLGALLAREPDIHVTGAASDPVFARQRMDDDWPDVIVLDVEMPRQDGISFLRQLMAERPTPVVICSTLTEKGAQTTLDALAAGAVSIVTKPRLGLREFLESSAAELVSAVRVAARARLGNVRPSMATRPPTAKPAQLSTTTDQVVAIGTSTGGTQALEAVFTVLPADCPGIVVVQHMPEKFTAAFADRLNRLSRCEVREAVDGDRVLPGLVLIAPGGRHMRLKRSGAQYRVQVLDGPPVNRHKPSVDVLFRSVAEVAGRNALGIIMTGMGDDGAQGLLQMREAGAHTLAQDEASCVVFGMPREAISCGAAERIISLHDIASAILSVGKRSGNCPQ